MARQRYVISDSDRWFVIRWLEKKLKNPTWLDEHRTYKAGRAFELIQDSHVQHPTDSLNRWCETWLMAAEWTQLKNAVRASRRRAKKPEIKTVTLSHNAWSLLNYVANKENCTLSEVIEHHLSHVQPNAASAP